MAIKGFANGITCYGNPYPVALQWFARLQQRSTLIFLQTYPTPQQAMSAQLPEIEAALRAGGHTNPTKTAAKIFETLHTPHLQDFVGERKKY